MKVSRRWPAVLLTVALLGLSGFAAGCAGGADDGGGRAEGPAGSIDVEGSDTMVNMAQAWAEDFMQENPGVIVSIKGGGSGNGIAALINGTVDFANASREMKDEEKAQAESKGITPVETAVANDGIAVVVNPSNRVEDLTVDQLGKIYRGEIKNWSEVGGDDRPIVLLSRDPSSGTYEYFKEAVVGEDAEYAAEAKLLPSTQAIIDETKANADAIGYVGVGYVTEDVKPVKVEGVESSIETVLDNTYPLSRKLYMYSNGEPSGAAKAYIDWIVSDAGQKIVEEQGYVPLER